VLQYKPGLANIFYRNFGELNKPLYMSRFHAFLLTLLFFILTSCSHHDDIRIAFTGDLMLDRGVRKEIEKNGIDQLLLYVKDLFLATDFVFVNFECTATDDSLKPENKKFNFRADTQWLGKLCEMRITHASLANNHSADYGEEGLKQTARNLKTHGLESLGYVTHGQSCQPKIIRKKGTEVGIFASTFLGHEKQLVCHEKPADLAPRITTFKAQHPDYLVIVYLHWGIELLDRPTVEQIEQAHQLIEAGADAVIGHHPHVVQAVERYKGKYIFYSLGNFIFDSQHYATSQGVVVEFFVSDLAIREVRVIPFELDHARPVPMDQEAGQTFLDKIADLSPGIAFRQMEYSWQLTEK
jgi:poly-gamma-glutamate capsule biosynthesis protein CapA/YwtB (metallophosphatase superfamily)